MEEGATLNKLSSQELASYSHLSVVGLVADNKNWHMNLAMTNAFKSSMQLDKRAPKLLGTTGGPPNSWILGNGKLTVCSKIFCQILFIFMFPIQKWKHVKYKAKSKSKLAWSTQQVSSMHLRHGTSLLSTPLPFWTNIITLDM